MKKIYQIGVGILSFLIAAAAGVTALVLYLNAPPAKAPQSTERVQIQKTGGALISIQNGESAASVGTRLAEADVIKSAFFWNMVSRFQKEYIKAGTYNIPVPSRALAVYSQLQTGEQVLIPVTIPEGSTIKQTAALWEKAGVCGADSFVQAASDAGLLETYHIDAPSMEGFLYPDTYYVPLPYSAKKAVMMMADTFYKRLDAFGIDASAVSAQKLFETVTLASIVEGEYRVPEEAPAIAGVFLNRLDIGMRLESCATVVYVITELLGKPHPARLWERDTKIENPYNTYLIRGLPPGPISSPGEVALKAAFTPQANDYLFFRLLDGRTGKHSFSRAFDEHIKAAALFVKG